MADFRGCVATTIAALLPVMHVGPPKLGTLNLDAGAVLQSVWCSSTAAAAVLGARVLCTLENTALGGHPSFADLCAGKYCLGCHPSFAQFGRVCSARTRWWTLYAGWLSCTWGVLG